MVTVVVGAGIIGTAIAHDLQEHGRQVVLADRDAPGKGASFGNMASIAVTEFMPASRPSKLRELEAQGAALCSRRTGRMRCARLILETAAAAQRMRW